MMDNKATEYIKDNLSHGKSKEEIYKELLGQGSTIETIEAGFRTIVSEEKKEDSQKKVIRIILTFATLLVGAGIFSFIASNWQEMDKAIKILVIVTAMLAAYSLGWYFKEKAGLVKTGGSLILLGAIIYGAGIFLVAQMFNIRASWPDGFILWMLGVIALAYAIDSYALFYLAIPLGIIAIAAHPFDIFTSFAGSFLLTSSLLLFSATVVTFGIGWMFRKRMSEEAKDYY